VPHRPRHPQADNHAGSVSFTRTSSTAVRPADAAASERSGRIQALDWTNVERMPPTIHRQNPDITNAGVQSADEDAGPLPGTENGRGRRFIRTRPSECTCASAVPRSLGIECRSAHRDSKRGPRGLAAGRLSVWRSIKTRRDVSLTAGSGQVGKVDGQSPAGEVLDAFIQVRDRRLTAVRAYER